jgi:hypothetical protein
MMCLSDVFFSYRPASISCHSQARIDQNRAEALRRKRAKEAWGSGEFVLLAMSLFHSSYTIVFIFFVHVQTNRTRAWIPL